MKPHRFRPLNEDEPVRCYHPPCRQCSTRHSPFEPCPSAVASDSASSGVLLALAMLLGIPLSICLLVGIISLLN